MSCLPGEDGNGSAGFLQGHEIAEAEALPAFGAGNASICGNAVEVVEALDGGPGRERCAAHLGESLCEV